ncbi:MAG TPA: PDZ domain-containing protein [Acidimicrobiales bacterium]|nr:PDZ domain-containing protein [Acidimicrobiales bacterium]
MAQDDEPQGAGDEEEPQSSPWLHPDDRLWRHPSEVRSNPPVAPSPPEGHLRRLARNTQARLWFVGVISGLVGALLSIGLLLATGEIGSPPDVIRSTVTSTVTTDPHSGGDVPGLIGTLGNVEPSIVGVTVNGPNGVETGSGVVVPPSVGNESYIVTEAGLFADTGSNTQIQVTTNWDYNATGSLVSFDQGSGIALIKAVLLPAKDVNAANLGSVANIQTGEEVLMVGSLPEAASDNASNFATGYINDTLSFIPPVNGSSDAIFSMLVANFSLPQGSPDFGGAIVDSNGNVLGIADYVESASGGQTYVYVTPIDTVMAEVTAMIKEGQAGPYPWLGVLQATDLSGPGAQSFNLSGGVQVETIAVGSPVAKAGLQDNDVISSLDGHSLPSVGALIEWLANAKPGQVVTIGWLHNGHQRTAAITLGTQPLSANPG